MSGIKKKQKKTVHTGIATGEHLICNSEQPPFLELNSYTNLSTVGWRMKCEGWRVDDGCTVEGEYTLDWLFSFTLLLILYASKTYFTNGCNPV